MQGKSDAPLLNELVGRRFLSRGNPVITDAVLLGRLNYRGVIRVQNHAALGFDETGIGSFGHFFDALSIIEQNAYVTDAANAGVETGRRLTGFQAGIAENTLF